MGEEELSADAADQLARLDADHSRSGLPELPNRNGRCSPCSISTNLIIRVVTLLEIKVTELSALLARRAGNFRRGWIRSCRLKRNEPDSCFTPTTCSAALRAF